MDAGEHVACGAQLKLLALTDFALVVFGIVHNCVCCVEGGISFSEDILRWSSWRKSTIKVAE